MRVKISTVMVLLTIAVAAGIAWSQSAPLLVSYQGRLNNSAGQPMADGTTVDLTFSFYGVASGGTAYLAVLQEDVPVKDGIFNVAIGSGVVTPGAEANLAAVFQKHTEVWMGVKVDSDQEMTPRSRISSVPYALSVDLGAVYTMAEADPDHDNDGHRNFLVLGDDCHDNNSTIYPGALEICDGIDNQCPGDTGYGQIDEGC